MAEKLFVGEILAWNSPWTIERGGGNMLIRCERQRIPTVVPLVDGSDGDTGTSWSCGQTSPGTGDSVMCKVNHEMTWPINFRLLPLTLLTSPRPAHGSVGATHRRLPVKVRRKKNAWEGLSTCPGGRRRLRGEARQRRRERTVHEGKAGFLHQKAVLQA